MLLKGDVTIHAMLREAQGFPADLNQNKHGSRGDQSSKPAFLQSIL